MHKIRNDVSKYVRRADVGRSTQVTVTKPTAKDAAKRCKEVTKRIAKSTTFYVDLRPGRG